MSQYDALLGQISLNDEAVELGNGINFVGDAGAVALNPATGKIDVALPAGGGTGTGSGGVAVTVAAVVAVTTSGLARTIDGVLCNDPEMVVLLTAQPDGTTNGPHSPRSGAWVRTPGFEDSAAYALGLGGLVLRGTVYAGGTWALANTSEVSLGTTPLSFYVNQFVDTTAADGKALTNTAGISSFTKISNAQIADNTIAVGKVASGGSGNNGLVAVVVAGVMALAAAPLQVSVKDEGGTTQTTRATIKASWLEAFDDGASIVVRPHANVARTRARAAVSTNVTSTTSISSTFDSLTLLRDDVVYFGGQTTPSQNGFYRVWAVSGGTASIVKLARLDAVISSVGMYAQFQEGTYVGQIRKFTGTGTLSGSVQMPAVSSSFVDFDNIAVDDFVIPGDNISKTAGNYGTIMARAQEAAYCGSARIHHRGNFTYRYTQTNSCWNYSKICGTHQAAFGGTNGTGQRLLFDGAAVGGFYGVGLGGYTDYAGNVWDSGIRGACQLEGLNCVFVNGASDNQFGVRTCGATFIDSCAFTACYGRGIAIDSTLGAVGSNANGWRIRDSYVNTTGLSAGYLIGGDTNAGLAISVSCSNYGQRSVTSPEFNPAGTAAFPGDDWGWLNLSFLVSDYVACQFASGHLGAVYDVGSFSRYSIYTEGGTASYLKTTNPFAGNATLRGTYISSTGVSVTFANSGSADTATRAAGSWVTDGYVAGDTVTFSGSVSNNVSGVLVTVTATVLTFGATTSLTNEGPVTVGVVGINAVSRTTGSNPSPLTKLPLLKCLNTNSWAMSGAVCDDGTGKIAIGENALMDRGLTGAAASACWHTAIGTGGNANTIATGYGTSSAAAEKLETLPGHAMGAGLEIFRKGVVLGDPSVGAVRFSYLPDASAPPATAVPDTGAPGSAESGWRGVGSSYWADTGGPRLMRRVLTNSGAASYNITYAAVANPSCDRTALAMTTATITISQGGHRYIAASSSAAAVITWGTAGALKGDMITIEVDPQTVGTVTMTNGGAGGTGAQPNKVLATLAEYRVEGKFDGTDWSFQAWACV